ncbi:MAG: rod shape-determining protein MreC [Pseudomonadota bacterium]
MAPPSPRRPGFSKRVQFSLFAGYVFAIIGALFAMLLIVTARVDPTGHTALQSIVADITSPISSTLRAAVNTVKGLGGGAAAYFDAASKNRAMSQELKLARAKLIEGEANALENRRLKHLLAIVEQKTPRPITARIVSSSATSSRRYATLAAGAVHGVEVGQPVRAADGLVGRIVQRGQFASRVLLIIDSEIIVPVKRVSDGAPALAIGLGEGRIELRTLAAGTNPFKIGDVFVTSGTGGIYTPGIPVAIAVRRTRDATFGRPLANPESLDFAIVEPVYIAPLPPIEPSETAQ